MDELKRGLALVRYHAEKCEEDAARCDWWKSPMMQQRAEALRADARALQAVERAVRDAQRLREALERLAAGDGQDSRAWRPVDPHNLPEPQWMLVTNNIDARDARGDMSHLWLVYMLHAPSLNEPQYGVTAFSGNRRICYITHWRPAIPEGADRMIVAATDPEGA